MATASENIGTSGRLRVVATEGETNAVSNWSDVSWSFYLDERVASNSTWSGGGIDARVVVDGDSEFFTDDFGFDWRSSGLQSKLVASGTTRVTHNANGTKTVTVEGRMGSTGTSGAGGPGTVELDLVLKTLTVVPGTPTTPTATRVSDTQVSVAWGYTSASNGRPVSFTVQRRIDGGAWADAVTIAATPGASLANVTVSAAANQKVEYRVRGENSAGSSGWSSASNAVYTTPAAPSGVTAGRAGGDISLSFTSNVGYSEHDHEVEHGTVTGGVTTWDGSLLTTLSAGVLTYTHTSPDPGDVHIYRVRAKAGSLTSAWASSGQVQLLTAPNKPTLPVMAAHLNKAADLVLTWTHNSVDTSPQSNYEVEYSTDGGDNWTSTTKTASTTSEHTFAGSTWSADDEVMFRVRTWGEATTGGSDSAGGSPWSDIRTTTFQTAPVTTITAPVDESTLDGATVLVTFTFAQAEAATFVSATITLDDGDGVIETVSTTSLAGTTLSTRVANGGNYTVTVTVRDSFGVWSDPVSAEFDVAYVVPVAAGVTVTWLEETGAAQLDVTIGEPGDGEVAAAQVTITRTIGSLVEVMLDPYPAAAELTILDTTPVSYGTNIYTVTTISGDGAVSDTVVEFVAEEGLWAYLSGGVGYATTVRFGGNLTVEATPTAEAGLVRAAGRSRPIGLYGTGGNLVVSGSATFTPDFGSTPEELEAFFLTPGKVCYRDPTGRRVFGQVSGKISRASSLSGEVSYTVTETS